MKFNVVISKGFFAAYSKTVNHEAQLTRSFVCHQELIVCSCSSVHNFFLKFSCHSCKYNIKFSAPRFIIIIYDWFAVQCKKDLLVQDPSSTCTCSATKLWHWVLAWSFSKDNPRFSLLKPFKFLVLGRPHTSPEYITLVCTNSVILVIQAICIFTVLGAVRSICKN